MPRVYVTGIVYHGTDAASAASIRQVGLDVVLWTAAGGSPVFDDKGFSVTTLRSKAEAWAQTRAGERGGRPQGDVVQADASRLPLQSGSPGSWADSDEFFILATDFLLAGPGTFQ
jgi:hypothetical protein